ncbi:MAG: ABC transporter permease, partial [Methanosarcinales archaeon]
MSARSNLRAVIFYARKDIFKDKKVFFFIVIAIIFATANLIIVNGFMDGMANDLIDNTVESSTGHLNIYPKEEDRFIEGLGLKEKKLKSIGEVVAYSPRLYSSGTISYKERSIAVDLIALDPSKEKRVTNILEKLDKGVAIDQNDKNDILISYRLAEDLNTEVGNSVEVVFESGKTKVYIVKGIVHTGLPEFDASTIIMTLEEANSQIEVNDKASIILVKLSDKNLADTYKQIIMQELGVFKVKTWTEEVEHIVNSMIAWKRFSDTVISVGLIAAAISVGVIVYINVIHKRRQIGIMKAIGANNSFIFMVFVLEAMLFGIIGVLGGDLLGYLGIKYFEKHPFWDAISRTWYSPRFYTYLLYDASIVSFAITIIAGIYPAIKASTINIIKAIWG